MELMEILMEMHVEHNVQVWELHVKDNVHVDFLHVPCHVHLFAEEMEEPMQMLALQDRVELQYNAQEHVHAMVMAMEMVMEMAMVTE